MQRGFSIFSIKLPPSTVLIDTNWYFMLSNNKRERERAKNHFEDCYLGQMNTSLHPSSVGKRSWITPRFRLKLHREKVLSFKGESSKIVIKKKCFRIQPSTFTLLSFSMPQFTFSCSLFLHLAYAIPSQVESRQNEIENWKAKTNFCFLSSLNARAFCV